MMLRPDHETLLQRHIDGTLTDDERAQLDRLLATDSDVRARAADVDQPGRAPRFAWRRRAAG